MTKRIEILATYPENERRRAEFFLMISIKRRVDGRARFRQLVSMG
jgi:hypothetical protein